MTTDSSPDGEALDAEKPLAEAEPAKRAPARSNAPDHGRHRPSLVARAAMSAGRLLPKGESGLRLAGALKPLALSGRAGPRDVVALGLKLRLHPHDNLTEKRLLVTRNASIPKS